MIFRKSAAIMALAAAGTAAILPAPASARHHYYDGYEQRYYNDGYADRNYGYYDRGGYDSRAYDRDYYGRTYYGGDYRAYRHHRCRRDGTTGALIGAIAGGLIGNGVAGRGDGTLGTLLGGGAGALLGREVGRSGAGC